MLNTSMLNVVMFSTAKLNTFMCSIDIWITRVLNTLWGGPPCVEHPCV